MPIADTAARAVTKRMPKVINARAHAVADYMTAGTFLALGAMFWGRNKRAALAAFLCGGATAASSMLTDYPGGVWRSISFQTHGKIDAGLAGLTAMMPNVMAFGDEPESKYFRGLALMETVVTGLTDFDSATGGKIIEMPARTA